MTITSSWIQHGWGRAPWIAHLPAYGIWPTSGRNLSFFILFSFFPHISSQKFSPSTFYSSSAKAAVWMLCEMLYWFLLLMPFSFGDRIALSVRCFLLSFIAEMDHPWPSLLSPCHMWKVPLPVMDITCLVEYCQNKFIWLSVIQNPLMYLHSLSLCAYTHTPWRVFLVIALPLLSWATALTLPRAQVPANLSKPLASEGNSTGSTSLWQNLTFESKSLTFSKIKSQTGLFKPQIHLSFKSH